MLSPSISGLRMRIVFFAGCTLLGLEIQSGPPWPGRPFVEARAYLYNLENKLLDNHAIVKNGCLDPTVVGPGMPLRSNEVRRVLEAANQDIGGLVEGLSKTYIPHHGIVFFNEKREPVASITLSFDGEGLRLFPPREFPVLNRELSEQEIQRLQTYLRVFRQVIEELGFPVFDTPFQYAEHAKTLDK